MYISKGITLPFKYYVTFSRSSKSKFVDDTRRVFLGQKFTFSVIRVRLFDLF